MSDASFVPDGASTFVEALRGWREVDPQHAAISSPDRRLTRQALDDLSTRLAGRLQAAGVAPGAFVTIVLPNDCAFFVAVVAAWKVGAIPQPVSHRAPVSELDRILDLARPAFVLGRALDSHPNDPVDLDELARATDDVVLVDRVSPSWKAPMSGGSTGKPKLIVSTLPARCDALLPFAEMVRMRPEGVSVIPTPLSHNMGLLFGTLTLLTGGEVVTMPRFDADDALRCIEERRATWVLAVPTMLHRMARRLQAGVDADLSSVQAIAVGASMCPPWIQEFWVDRLGPERMVEFYSTTENQIVAIADGTTWRERPGSVGRLVLGEIEVRDDDGRPVHDGRVGELWMRRGAGSPPPYRYVGATPTRDAEGWETVGDLGRVEDGFVYLADRRVDVVIVGGSNVHPAEVEAAIEEHPLVLSSVVLGRGDEEYGEVLHAVVQSSSPVSDDELVQHLRERLQPYKIPRTFERTDLPIRDDAGKVRRGQWRQRLEELGRAAH